MGRIRLVVEIVACVTAMSVVSSAQSRLFVFGGAGSAGVSLDTGAISSVDTGDLFQPEVVDGGRYLAAFVSREIAPTQWRNSLRVWSPRTGETFTPVDDVMSELGSPATLVGDANHARVFVWNRDAITSVSTSGVVDIVSNVPRPPPGFGEAFLQTRLMAYAPVAEVLFVVTGADIELAQYSADGTLLRVTPLPATPAYVAVTSDGRRVFTVTFSTLLSLATLRSYDALTGAELGSVELLPGELSASGPRGLLLDEAGERVLIPNGPVNAFLEVRSFDLTLLQDIRYPTGEFFLCRFDIGVDERTGAAAIASTEWHAPSQLPGVQNPRVSLVNLATGAVIASAPFTNPLPDAANRGCGGGAVVLTPPPAPSLEPPVVAEGAVTLAWPAVRTATNYQIEAGPAPGATAFTARTNSNLSLTVSAVPPGTYYVRLRALNDSGASAASPEIVVTVP